MAVSSKHILQQGPVLASLGRTALSALQQHFTSGSNGHAPTLPGPEIVRVIQPRPKELIRDYVRHVGGDPRAYRKVLPPHLFPQWGFGLASQTLAGIPYPLVKVLNGGCRVQVNAPLPSDQPLTVRAHLAGIDDNGRRAVLNQRIITGTQAAPDALIADLYAIVPLKGGKKKTNGARKEKPRVPADAREVDYWRLRPDAGLDFAKLTGDFNPVHWVPAYARASGFRNTILHGFSTLARAWEGLNRQAFKGARTIRVFDVKFTRPLVLPARVGLYVGSADSNTVYVGDAPDGPAYMTGSYEVTE